MGCAEFGEGFGANRPRAGANAFARKDPLQHRGAVRVCGAQQWGHLPDINPKSCGGFGAAGRGMRCWREQNSAQFLAVDQDCIEAGLPFCLHHPNQLAAQDQPHNAPDWPEQLIRGRTQGHRLCIRIERWAAQGQKVAEKGIERRGLTRLTVLEVFPNILASAPMRVA